MARENLVNMKRAWTDMMVLFVGHGRRYTVEALSEASGIPASTIYAIRRGTHMPKWSEAMELLKHLPTSAADMVLAPAGLAVRPIEGEACNYSLIADLGRTTAHFTDALEDGKIDHREEAMAEPLVRAVVARGTAWLAARDQNKGRASLSSIPVKGKVS